MKRLFLLLAVALLPLLGGGSTAYAYDWHTDGERLHYSVRYGVIRAGEAEVLFRAHPFKEGTVLQPYEIIARAWTKSSLFHLKERLRVDGNHVAGQSFMPKTYHQMQQENDFKADKWVMFDHSHTPAQATYDNRRNDIAPETFEIEPEARDMLSALFYLRGSVEDLNVGEIKIPVVSLHRTYDMTVRISEPELLKTKSGQKIAVRKVRPHLVETSGGGKVKDDWVLTITDDSRRLPVMIELKSKFGTFRATLMRHGPAATESLVPGEIPETGDFIN